jgi:hypothetical protein
VAPEGDGVRGDIPQPALSVIRQSKSVKTHFKPYKSDKSGRATRDPYSVGAVVPIERVREPKAD